MDILSKLLNNDELDNLEEIPTPKKRKPGRPRMKNKKSQLRTPKDLGWGDQKSELLVETPPDISIQSESVVIDTKFISASESIEKKEKREKRELRNGLEELTTYSEDGNRIKDVVLILLYLDYSIGDIRRLVENKTIPLFSSGVKD
jgi:hypothetical protein